MNGATALVGGLKRGFSELWDRGYPGRAVDESDLELQEGTLPKLSRAGGG